MAMEFIGSILTAIIVIGACVIARDWLADLKAEVVEIRNQVLALRKELAEAKLAIAENDLAVATEFKDLRERLADGILDRLDT